MATAMPSLMRVQPQAVLPGVTTEVILHGDHFTDDLRLWTSFSEKVEFVKRINAKQAIFRITVPKASPTQVGVLRVYAHTGLSGPILIMIDPLSTTSATSTDKSKPQMLKLPVAVDGRMGGLSSHWFNFEAEVGQRVSIEVYAERIASPADPMIRLIDPKGHEVGYADDDDVLGSDAGLNHVVKVAGQYRLELRDVQYRGGLPYRLRIGDFTIWPKLGAAKGQVTEKEPNDNFKQASPIEMGKTVFGNIEESSARDHFRMKGKKGQWVSFRGFSRSIGSPSYLYLELLDVFGKSIATTGSENLRQPVLRHKLSADGEFILRVEELLRRGGPRFVYRIDTMAGSGEFNLNLKNGKNTSDKFWGIVGQQVEISVQVDRKGYDGPINLAVTNGWAISGNVIKAKVNAAQLIITIPKNAKPGRLHHVVIQGKAEGGATATLDVFANLRQRWPQMAFPPAPLRGVVPVAVIEPTQVTLASVKLKPSAKVKVRVTTRRPPEPIGLKAAPQAITIELNNLPVGVSAPDQIIVDAKKDFVEFELTATADAKIGKADVVAIAKSKYRGAEWMKKSPPVIIEVVPE